MQQQDEKVNSSMLPADAGCIVDNIDAVTAIYQAVCFGEPLMSRIVTVTGDAVQNPCNFEVPFGMPVRTFRAGRR